MARTLRDSKIETREQRLKLKARRKPYWRSMFQGAAIGYRRTKNNGTWVFRRYVGDQRYSEEIIGTADDFADADGVTVLTYQQAHQQAADRFKQMQAERRGVTRNQHLTVNDVVQHYLDDYRMRGKSIRNTEIAIKAHIAPTLGDERVRELTPAKIEKWLHGLVKQPVRRRKGRKVKRTRAEKKPVQTVSRTISDGDQLRARKATANRIYAILKAALNFGFKHGEIPDDAAWRRVRPFRCVDSPSIRFLLPGQIKLLLNACSGAFRTLVEAALLTGCRYNELATLQCSDFIDENAQLTIRGVNSKNRKSRHVYLTKEGTRFFENLTAGKQDNELIFRPENSPQWSKSLQVRRLAAACKAAKIDPPISFHDLRHTYASSLAMRGVPLQVIAEALGHADTRITQRHYAHLLPSYVADTIRANVPEIGVTSGNVRKIKVKA